MDDQIKFPLISVCIPTFNMGSLIADAIHSVLYQQYPNMEILVLDNCSEDNTAEVVSRFSDKRIRYYRHDKTIDPYENANACLDLAKGEYIKYLGADDVLLPGVLEKQAKIFMDHPNVGVVTCDMIIVDETYDYLGSFNFRHGFVMGQRLINLIANTGVNYIGGPSNVMFKKIIGYKFSHQYIWLDDLNYFCKILQDYDFASINEIGILYRQAASSFTFQNRDKKNLGLEERCKFIADHFEVGWLAVFIYIMKRHVQETAIKSSLMQSFKRNIFNYKTLLNSLIACYDLLQIQFYKRIYLRSTAVKTILDKTVARLKSTVQNYSQPSIISDSD